MVWFTFEPEWVIPNCIVLPLGAEAVGFIVRKEARPLPILSEVFCFISRGCTGTRLYKKMLTYSAHPKKLYR